MALNLIWTQDPETLSETGWIRWLLGGLDFTEYVAPGLDLFKENALYIISSNRHPLSRLPTRFAEGLASVERKGLFQISDKSYSGGYDIYAKFDFVLRNHYSSIFQHPGIMVLPLGPTNYDPNRRATESAISVIFYGLSPGRERPLEWKCTELLRTSNHMSATFTIAASIKSRRWTAMHF